MARTSRHPCNQPSCPSELLPDHAWWQHSFCRLVSAHHHACVHVRTLYPTADACGYERQSICRPHPCAPLFTLCVPSFNPCAPSFNQPHMPSCVAVTHNKASLCSMRAAPPRRPPSPTAFGRASPTPSPKCRFSRCRALHAGPARQRPHVDGAAAAHAAMLRASLRRLQ